MEDSKTTPADVRGLVVLHRGLEWLAAAPASWMFQDERTPWKLEETWRSPFPPLTVRARLDVGGMAGTGRVTTVRFPPARFTVTDKDGWASKITPSSGEIIFTRTILRSFNHCTSG